MVETMSRHRIDEVFRAQAPRMWRALLASTGDREVASDAVAEAFAQVLRRGDAVRDPERWVWKAAYRIAAGAMSDRSRTTPLVDDDRPSFDGEPAWELRAALMRLPARQRDALVLHHYAGYPTAQVAEMIASTPAAVRVHLMRGRRRLMRMLEEEGGNG